jgi:hypothetical protein
MTDYNGIFDILVLGNGICAQSILFEMIKDNKFDLDNLSVGQISDNNSFLACSENTTSVVSLNGTTRGMSDLGDLIIDSYDYTVEYIKKNSLKSFKKGEHYFLPSPKKEKLGNFVRRFGEPEEIYFLKEAMLGKTSENYLVDPDILKNELEAHISKSIIKKINSLIISVDNNIVTCLDGSMYKARIIISCLGAYTKEIFPHVDVDKTKKVPGDYLVFENCQLSNENFVLSCGHHNLVYRHFSKTVLIGGTSLHSQWDSVDYIEIKDQYDFYRGILKEKLPEFSKGKIRSGMRHKGVRRRPFAGELFKNTYSLHGVYKNGYTFSFYLGRKILNQIQL